MQFNTPPISESVYYGYDDTHPAQELGRGVFTKADNVFVSDAKISKVPGSSSIAASIASKPFNSIAAFELISSSTKYIIVSIDGASNAQLYKWAGSGNFVAIGSANLTNSTQVFFETANDILFGFNGVEEVDYDGTTVTKNRSGLPLGFYPKWFHNYLFVARTGTNPNRLFWSNLGDPTTFNSANFVDINPGDSDAIMGLAKLQDELLVFKRNTIWAITGWSGSSFSSTTIAAQNTNGRIFGYGTVSAKSIVEAGNEVYFLSMLGSTPVIRSLRKTINSVTLGGGIISDNIKTTMDGITKSALSKVVGWFDGRYAYWAIPTGGASVNNKIIVLDTWTIQSSRGIYPFTTMTGKNVTDACLSTIPGYSNVYFADSSPTSGLVFKFDTSVYTDNGTNITIDVRTRKFMFDPAREYKYKYIFLKYDVGVSSTLNVNALVDLGSAFSLQKAINLAGSSPGLGPTGTLTLGVSLLGGGTVDYTRVDLAHLTGKMMQIQFSETSANAVGIYDYQIYGLPKGLRAR